MKATIKIKRFNKAIPMPQVIDAGEWIDLRAREDVEVGENPITLIPLNIAAQLPKGYEAIVVSRSSTGMKFHVWNAGSLGIIDHSYQGNNDEWKYPATTIGCCLTKVHAGDRICQFRIQLSQKATMWQRIKWLFTSGVRIVEVDELQGSDRNGFGSTGKR